MKNTEGNISIETIDVQDLKGNKVNLLELFKDHPLLLLIYNNKCLGCTGRAIPLAHKFQQQFNNLKVVGIHSNFGSIKTTEEDIKSIFTVQELPFPIFLDEDHSVFNQFKSEGTPQWLVINHKSELFRSIFGSQSGAHNRLLYALDDICKMNS